jgi:Activator of aromatic catabolism/V4R domain/Bacterial regulatory protein, Fis family/Sigma-54 interaction domain
LINIQSVLSYDFKIEACAMQIPFETSKVLDRGGKPSVRELLAGLVFNPIDGTIRLNGDRVVMQRATVGAELKREIIRLLGPQEARTFLLRLGFLNGQADARFVRTHWPNLDVGDAFTAGTRLHTYSGVVRVETLHNDFDFRKGRFSAEMLWHDSVEAAEFKATRPTTEPMCWTQLGYASGYATEFFDTLIIYKETECAAQGHRHCKLIGKTVSGWGADDPEVRLFLEQIATVDGRTFKAPAARLPARQKTDSLSRLDLLILAPIKDDLDRLANISLPILVTGEPGTGRSQAARYLQRAAHTAEHDTLSVLGLNVDHKFCDEILGRNKNGRRSANTNAVIINAIENIPIEIQPHFAQAVKERIADGRPNIIGVATNNLTSNTWAADLWVLLSGLQLRLPNLAQRTAEQRWSIAECLISLLANKMGLETPQLDAVAIKLIQQLPWPGNMRQMRWAFTAVLDAQRGDKITGEQIEKQVKLWPFATLNTTNEIQSTKQMAHRLISDEDFSLTKLEQALYQAAMERAEGNVSAAARLLGLSRPQFAYRAKTLRHKLNL